MTDPDDDLLAGEYVLGTLDDQARTAATLRRSTDATFDGLVSFWESRLTPLSERTPEVDPPAHLWALIQSRIAALGHGAAVGNAAGATIIRLNRQVTWWRRAAAASMALAACLAVWAVVVVTGPGKPGQTLVAVLQKTDETPAFVVRADLRDRSMAVKPIAAPPPPGKSYELWVIDPSIGPPKSLGVLGTDSTSRTTLPDVPAATLMRATYAVTIEAQGGSPNGKPTSAPVFFGHLLGIEP
jgi:anti-sigma-K factor RskA